MKKIKYTLILLLALSMQIHAQQPYKSCLDGDIIKWSVMYEMYDLPFSSENIIAYGDTIINELAYKNIMPDYTFSDFEETNTNWKNYIPDWNHEPFGRKYYIRESDDASRLYIFDLYYKAEYLISDLNLEVGDEFQVPEEWRYIDNFSGREFLTVDSVYIENGLKHVRMDHLFIIYFGENDRHKLTFIEGIGPNCGFFPLPGYTQIVNCFQNSSLFYKNELIPYPCGYIGPWDGIEPVFYGKDYHLQIKEGKIEINFSIRESRQISIYDISGRPHYSRNFSHEKEAIIPTASFPKGIYLLKIYNKNNSQINVHKLIL